MKSRDKIFNDRDGKGRSADGDSSRVGVALASHEVVSRFGGANAEFIKGYRGVDNETGQRLAKGLADIAQHKVNIDPREAAKNIKQQAGYSAEVAATSRDNAEALISESKVRIWRSDDLPQYGKNHNVVDRVKVLNGEVVEGSQAQMKFVGNRDQLFERIAREDGKFSRYRGVKLELPSEQFEGADQYCRDKANLLRDQAQKAEQAGRREVAEKLRREAENFDQLAEKVTDSGLSTEDALFYREHPRVATALDIARTSHRAGLEGAKLGVVIGGCISVLQQFWSVAQGEKEVGDAAKDIAIDTAKAGALGYGTGFVGSAVKGTMQQSSRQTIRTLAGTNAPTIVVGACLALGGSIKRYVSGEISEAQLLTEVGEKGAGLISSSMMATLGQLAVPVPVVGAVIGGMIGYTLSSLFYQSALDAARGVEQSREALARTRQIQMAARAHIDEEHARLDDFVNREIPRLRQETQQFFSAMEVEYQSVDDLAAAINCFANLLGKRLEFRSVADFDDFMLNSDRSLAL